VGHKNIYANLPNFKNRGIYREGLQQILAAARMGKNQRRMQSAYPSPYRALD
jgi:hypothetical protein